MIAKNVLMLQQNHWVSGVRKKHEHYFYDNIKEKYVEKWLELKRWNKNFAVMQYIYLINETELFI